MRSCTRPKKRQQVHKCCDPRCNATKNYKNYLHTLPKDENRRRAWGLALGLNVKASYRVCSDHFEDSDYIPSSGLGFHRKLKRTALPRPFPDPVESDNAVMDDDELLKRQEALKEFEQVPSDMKILFEDVPALQEEARNLLCCISSEECRVYIERYIADHGNKPSSVLKHGGLGPFTIFPDMTRELFDKLQMYENELVGGNFIFGKLLTEVIIWSIAKLRNCTREEAETYFDERSEKVEVLHTD